MILNDRQIIELARQGMIQPFEAGQVRELLGIPAISYGMSCSGYDVRLSPKEFLVPNANFQGESIDPKKLSPSAFVQVELKTSTRGNYFEIPPYSFGLGISVERFDMPSDVMAIAVSKSTYARVGMLTLTTPFENSWRGTATLEFANHWHLPLRIYANEGVLQLLFFRGEPPQVPYGDRSCGGKYQNQENKVVLPRI